MTNYLLDLQMLFELRVTLEVVPYHPSTSQHINVVLIYFILTPMAPSELLLISRLICYIVTMPLNNGQRDTASHSAHALQKKGGLRSISYLYTSNIIRTFLLLYKPHGSLLSLAYLGLSHACKENHLVMKARTRDQAEVLKDSHMLRLFTSIPRV